MPGSHRWTPQQRATWEEFIQPSDVVPLRVLPGSVLLWRSTMLHGVTPHHDREQWRLHLMYSYVPRWFRPSFRGAFKNITNDPALLQRSSPSALASPPPSRGSSMPIMTRLPLQSGASCWGRWVT